MRATGKVLTPGWTCDTIRRARGVKQPNWEKLTGQIVVKIVEILVHMAKPALPRAFKNWAKRFVGPKKMSPASRILFEGHQRINQGLSSGEIRLRENLQVNIHPQCRVGFEYFCYKSPDMVAELDSFLTRTRNCSRLLDIGALHGIFSLAFTKAGAGRRALAIDASPLAFARLLYNVHKNPDLAIALEECAVSDAEGVLEMVFEWEHAVVTSSPSVGSSIRVPARTGDSLCEKNAFVPDVIKIDVEGHETAVFRGLSKTLGSHRPLIFLEVHPGRIAGLGGSLEALLAEITKHGYKIDSSRGGALDRKAFLALVQEERVVLIP